MLDGRFHGLSTEDVVATLITQYRPDGPDTTVAPPIGLAPTDADPRVQRVRHARSCRAPACPRRFPFHQ